MNMKRIGFCVLLLAECHHVHAAGVIEETPQGMHAGIYYLIGDVVSTNATFRVTVGGVFPTHTTNDTVDYWIYAFRNIGTNAPGGGPQRVYSAVPATNTSSVTSNREFAVIGHWAPVARSGVAGYVIFASLNGGPATNWTELDSAPVDDWTSPDNGFVVWNDYGFLGWTNGPRVFPPVPASPFFLGTEVLNTGAAGLLTNVAPRVIAQGVASLVSGTNRVSSIYASVTNAVSLALDCEDGTNGFLNLSNLTEGVGFTIFSSVLTTNRASYSISH